MCTLTHFAHPQKSYLGHSPSLYPLVIRHPELHCQEPAPPRFQVVLAGNAFFHIKEISTGHVRGFRANHNEACALARSLESRLDA
ncbi:MULTISPECIES: hypothetical protein [unclassified Pseudomonas]|uniref:DRBM domain-containing protein n=1 Tax=Pseudomonas sp. MYb327 TaxID=2745230 RepID=A0AAU8ED43_9PSED